jgi:putative transposase
MPRQARLDSPGTLHHVMMRGIERKRIFREDEDRKDFVSRLRNLSQETGTRLLAWSLLNTHVHLLLFSGPSGLSLFMRRLLSGYSQAFNRRHRRNGHLFQNRFKSIICEEETYLLELVRYIHLNPLRASAVANLAELDRYPWSGHGALVGKEKNDWQERDYVLQQFHRNEKKAIRVYRRFMEEGKDQGRQPELVGGGLVRSRGGWSQVLSLRSRGEIGEHDSRILGGGDFVAEILKEADQKVTRFLPIKRREALIKDVIQKISQEGGVGEKELGLGGQARRVSNARAKVAWQLSREYGIPMAEIARHVGVCTSAIANAIRKKEMQNMK